MRDTGRRPAGRRAAPAAQLLVATRSALSTLIRDPEPEMVAAIAAFLDRGTGARPADPPA